MNVIHTLIVDDEPAARDGMRQLLSRDPEIAVAGECANGVQAAGSACCAKWAWSARPQWCS